MTADFDDATNDRNLQSVRQNLRAALTKMVQTFAGVPPEDLADPPRIRRILAASEALAQLLDQLPAQIRAEPDVKATHLQTDIFLADLKSSWGARLRDSGLRFQILATPDLPQILNFPPLLLDQLWTATLGNDSLNSHSERITIRFGMLSDRLLQISIQHEGPRVIAPDAAAVRNLQELLKTHGGDVDLQNRMARSVLILVSLPLQNGATSALPPPRPIRENALINSTQFASLLKMAGPEGATEILLHFQKDLTRVVQDLVSAAQGPDWPTIRAQTHILIALAGTAGAEQLSKAAQAMNALAHTPPAERDAYEKVLPQLLESLEELQQFIRSKLQETGLE